MSTLLIFFILSHHCIFLFVYCFLFDSVGGFFHYSVYSQLQTSMDVSYTVSPFNHFRERASGMSLFILFARVVDYFYDWAYSNASSTLLDFNPRLLFCFFFLLYRRPRHCYQGISSPWQDDSSMKGKLMRRGVLVPIQRDTEDSIKDDEYILYPIFFFFI